MSMYGIGTRGCFCGLLFLGMLTCSANAEGQCSRDIDCKGDRICQRGECVEVALAPVSPPTAAPPALAPPLVAAPPVPVLVYERNPRNVISTNPLNILGGSVGIQYERVVVRWLSIAIGVSFYDSAMDPINSSDVDVIGGGVTVQPRFYLLRRGAPRGLYLSPVVSVFYLSAPETDLTYAVSGVGYSVGGLLGWAWQIGWGLNIKFGLGAQYIHFTLMDDYGDTVGVSTPALLGELSFGWSF